MSLLTFDLGRKAPVLLWGRLADVRICVCIHTRHFGSIFCLNRNALMPSGAKAGLYTFSASAVAERVWVRHRVILGYMPYALEPASWRAL